MKNGKQRLMDLVTVIDRINGNIGRVLATFVLVMAGIMLHKEHISMDLFYVSIKETSNSTLSQPLYQWRASHHLCPAGCPGPGPFYPKYLVCRLRRRT